MIGAIAIALGCTSCFILGVIIGMMTREQRILEMTKAMEELLEATTEYVAAMKREYGISEKTEDEGEI